MAKNTRWSSDDFKKANLIQGADGTFTKANHLVAKSINKIDPEDLFKGLSNPAKKPLKKKEGIPMFNTEPKGNAKIKNATKTVIDGISFDSRLEAHLYGLLKGAGIAFEFQKVYWLMENFKYRGETIRGIKIIMDFWLPTRNILIDSKGWQTYDGKLKHKMLKQHLKTVENNEPEILMPSTKKECDLLLNKLLYGTA